MRSVSKPKECPEGLFKKASEVCSRLLAEGEAHKARNGIYADQQAKAILIKVYKGKCAYCDTHFSKNIAEVTVEHYRPQSVYWWLCYEWSNLLPVCQTCNTKKADSFGLYDPKATDCCVEAKELKNYGAMRVNVPVLDNGSLDYDRCHVAHPALQNEQALTFHPEQDCVSDFFGFDRHNGSLIPAFGLEVGTYSYSKAVYTINLLDRDTGKKNNRKKIIHDLAVQIKAQCTKAIPVLSGLNEKLDDLNLINDVIALFFSPIFKPFFEGIEDKEHSFVYRWAFEHFESDVLGMIKTGNTEVEQALRAIVKTAFELYKKEHPAL